MIYSSRDILELRNRFLAINTEQWVLLTLGLVVGAAVWLFVNQRVVRCIVLSLKDRLVKDNGIAVVEGMIGAMVFVVNAGLVYLATLITSFFLFAFAGVGALMGAWIAIPASFE